MENKYNSFSMNENIPEKFEATPDNDQESIEPSIEIIKSTGTPDGMDIPIEEVVVIPEITVLKTPSKQVLEKVMPDSMEALVDGMTKLIKKVRETNQEFDAGLAGKITKSIQVHKNKEE